MARIPIAGPWITQRERDYVADAVANAWYDKAGMYHERFERAFTGYLGSKYAISLPSCTSAIHLSLLAIGVGPGDEVIVPDITWIASAAPISYVGATPVFADVDPKHWCLSAEGLKACLTPRTKAVIAVDLYGNMPDVDSLLAVTGAHGIPLIEDAAEALSSRYRGRPAGSFGITGVFSFHGSKTLTTGEGGMLVTNEQSIFDRVQVLRDHGRQPGDRMFYNTEVGYKYKMSSLQAALGLAQLERLEELVERKRQIFQWYQDRLRNVPGLAWNPEPAGVRNSYWMVTVLVDRQYKLTKTQLMERLSREGIDTRPFFHALSGLPAYAQHAEARKARERNRVSHDLADRGINLPSALCLTEQQVDFVCQKLQAVLRSA